MFPSQRFRRLRLTPSVRQLVREHKLSPSDFIMPLFVIHGRGRREAIPSMPGQFQFSLDQSLNQISQAVQLGIRSVLLFGIPKTKDALGREAYSPRGIIQEAIKALKSKFSDLVVMADLCFCEYTTHGHCGVVRRGQRGGWELDNDATLRLIERTAIAQAKAGADFVAPSGMIDGAVAAIRRALDRAGFRNTGILAYAAKYASAFYGPFRDAVHSAPQFGDRRTYQMDNANVREALKEVQQDLAEGADMVMVKPALSYLDVISKVRAETKVPVVAYNVSGEYAMVKAAEKLGWLDGAPEFRTAQEILTSMKRAGADLIITYHALEVARWLKSARA